MGQKKKNRKAKRRNFRFIGISHPAGIYEDEFSAILSPLDSYAGLIS
jgi:hypothetical protein